MIQFDVHIFQMGGEKHQLQVVRDFSFGVPTHLMFMFSRLQVSLAEAQMMAQMSISLALWDCRSL